MNVWLDDERPMPSCYSHHVRTAPEAIELLKSGQVTRISLDHDLGPAEAGTGYDVALWIEKAAFDGTVGRIGLAVHTANVVGRKKMCAALENAAKYWDQGKAAITGFRYVD